MIESFNEDNTWMKMITLKIVTLLRSADSPDIIHNLSAKVAWLSQSERRHLLQNMACCRLNQQPEMPHFET